MIPDIRYCHLSIHLSIHPISFHPSIHPSIYVCLCVCLFVWLLGCLVAWLLGCLVAWLLVCLFVCLFLCSLIPLFLCSFVSCACACTYSFTNAPINNPSILHTVYPHRSHPLTSPARWPKLPSQCWMKLASKAFNKEFSRRASCTPKQVSNNGLATLSKR